METTVGKPEKSVHHMLLDEMRSGIYRNADMLPPENILAERLSISRTQLRDSLAQLEREGFITRRHGIGTIINRHVLSVKVRADMEVEFCDMIEKSGYGAKVKAVRAERVPADSVTADRLNIRPGDPVFMVTRTVLAGGKPTIYCEDYFPVSLVTDNSYSRSELNQPIFTFLKKHCGLEPYMDLTDIHPVLADRKLSGLLDVPKGTPLLFMDERDFDKDGVTILYSRQYYIDGIITHTLLRRKF